jgi:hypothetical protein
MEETIARDTARAVVQVQEVCSLLQAFIVSHQLRWQHSQKAVVLNLVHEAPAKRYSFLLRCCGATVLVHSVVHPVAQL